MTVTANINENICTLTVEGDVDTLTSPDLEKAVEEYAPQCEKMTLDLAGVEYISSAGVRAILKARQIVGGDRFVLKNLQNNVMEIFRITGFAKVLNIE